MTRAGIFLLMVLGGAGLAQAYPIAGTQPDRRPDGAPKITEAHRDAAAKERYLFGVSKPVPTTLGAQSQGSWYTPFDHPGMYAPYDPRGWHSRAGGK